MDLVYMPEVLTYGSFRTPAYRDYEQPWNRNYFQYGKSMSNQTTRQQQEQFQQQQLRVSHKENCHLCKESKRRTLGTYIRRRSRTTSCSEIHEEEDEEKEETIKDVMDVKEVEGNYVKDLKNRNDVKEIKLNAKEEEKKTNDEDKSKKNLGERKTDKFSFAEIKKSICALDKSAIK